MKSAKGKLVRIPMRYVDGAWVLEFGGQILAEEGATAEMVVEASVLSDKALVGELLKETKLKILDQGTVLRVMLNVKDMPQLTGQQTKRLLSWREVQPDFDARFVENWAFGSPSFVEVALQSPNLPQFKSGSAPDAGLWLRLEGLRSVGLISSTIEMPADVSSEPAISLNHAFTLLSQIYEPWRKSHTGNVYSRFFYRETNERWYPLNLLRDARIAEREQEIAFGLWKRLVEMMKSKEAKG